MAGKKLAKTPQPPYYTVIFTSRRTEDNGAAYAAMADRMVELASSRPGFLGHDSARGEDGIGITVSYWESEAAIKAWKADAEHREAQRLGRERFYSEFEVRVARVERAYGGPKK